MDGSTADDAANAFAAFCNEAVGGGDDGSNVQCQTQPQDYLTSTDQQQQQQSVTNSPVLGVVHAGLMDSGGSAVDQLSNSASRPTSFFLDSEQGNDPSSSSMSVSGQMVASQQNIYSSEHMLQHPSFGGVGTPGNNNGGAVSWSFPSPPLSVPFETSPITYGSVSSQYFHQHHQQQQLANTSNGSFLSQSPTSSMIAPNVVYTKSSFAQQQQQQLNYQQNPSLLHNLCTEPVPQQQQYRSSFPGSTSSSSTTSSSFLNNNNTNSLANSQRLGSQNMIAQQTGPVLIHGSSSNNNNNSNNDSSNLGQCCVVGGPTNFQFSQPQTQQQHLSHSTSRILAPLVGQCELKLIELNKMLQQRPLQQQTMPNMPNADHAGWWEQFVGTFFDDEAEVTFRLFVDDGPKSFSIHRVLIPRLFRSFYECGCRDLSFLVTHPRELSNGSLFILESPNAHIVAFYMRPQPVCITTEGNMTLHFSCCNDPTTLRIKNWTFTVSNSNEYLSREYMNRFFQIRQDFFDMAAPCMRYGLPDGVIEFLRLAAILEPMKDLMALQKNSHMPPRQCLVTVVQERMNAAANQQAQVHAQAQQQQQQQQQMQQMQGQLPPQQQAPMGARMSGSGSAPDAGSASAEKTKPKPAKRKRSKANQNAQQQQQQQPQQLKQEAQSTMSPAFASPQPMGSPSFFPGQQPPPPPGPGQQSNMGPPPMGMPPMSMGPMSMSGGPSPGGPSGYMGSPYQPQQPMQGAQMTPQQQQQQQQRPVHLQLGPPGGYAGNPNASTPTQQFGGPPGSLSVHSNA